jgi:hypothetical protein
MRPDHHKKCLDDSIVVDTSNARSPGLVAIAASVKITSIFQRAVKP